MDKETAIILTQSKSMAVGLIITWFFGGLGVFYVSILGGLVLGGLEFIAWIVTFVTFGFGVVLLIPIHIAALIWTFLGVKKHNSKLIAQFANSAPLAPVTEQAIPAME